MSAAMRPTITFRTQITSLRNARAGATYLGERTISLCPALSQHNPFLARSSKGLTRWVTKYVIGGPGMRSPSRSDPTRPFSWQGPGPLLL